MPSRLLLVISLGACIMPAHRRAATVVNGTLAGVGVIGLVGPSFGDNSSNSGFDLDLTPMIREAGAGLLVLALVGEALSYLITPDETSSVP